MPEQREVEAIKLQFQHSISAAQKKGSSFGTLLGIWCDPTKAERQRIEEDKHKLVEHTKLGVEDPETAGKGYVVKLNPFCHFVRGKDGKQTALFPPQLRVTADCPNPEPLSVLGLVGPESISATSRALLLNLGCLTLMVRIIS